MTLRKDFMDNSMSPDPSMTLLINLKKAGEISVLIEQSCQGFWLCSLELQNVPIVHSAWGSMSQCTVAFVCFLNHVIIGKQPLGLWIHSMYAELATGLLNQ